MTFNNTQKLLAGALAFALVAGLTSPAFAQTPDLAVDTVDTDNYNPVTASVAVGFDVPISMLCTDILVNCVVIGEDEFLEFDCGAGSCWMTVEDQFIVGDFFEVFDGGKSLGLTPEVEVGGDTYSVADFCFSSGEHVATIQDQTDAAGLPAEFQVTITLHENDCPKPVAGELLSLDSSTLVIGGLASSAVWIIPTIAGIAGAGVYLVKLRTNRD